MHARSECSTGWKFCRPIHGYRLCHFSFSPPFVPLPSLFSSIFVTHKSTVVRTVMCRQDGRGWFPILMDDLSKCRTISQRKSQLSYILCVCDIYINDLYKQYTNIVHFAVPRTETASKMHQTCIWNTGHMLSIAGPVLASAVCTRLSSVKW